MKKLIIVLMLLGTMFGYITNVKAGNDFARVDIVCDKDSIQVYDKLIDYKVVINKKEFLDSVASEYDQVFSMYCIEKGFQGENLYMYAKEKQNSYVIYYQDKNENWLELMSILKKDVK